MSEAVWVQVRMSDTADGWLIYDDFGAGLPRDDVPRQTKFVDGRSYVRVSPHEIDMAKARILPPHTGETR